MTLHKHTVSSWFCKTNDWIQKGQRRLLRVFRAHVKRMMTITFQKNLSTGISMVLSSTACTPRVLINLFSWQPYKWTKCKALKLQMGIWVQSELTKVSSFLGVCCLWVVSLKCVLEFQKRKCAASHCKYLVALSSTVEDIDKCQNNYIQWTIHRWMTHPE